MLVSRSLYDGPLTGRARRDDVIFVVFLTSHILVFHVNKKPRQKQSQYSGKRREIKSRQCDKMYDNTCEIFVRSSGDVLSSRAIYVRANLSCGKNLSLFFPRARQHLHSTTRSCDSNLSSANLERQLKEINSFSFRAYIHAENNILFFSHTQKLTSRARRNNASKKCIRFYVAARQHAVRKHLRQKRKEREFASKSYHPSLLLSFFLSLFSFAFTLRVFLSIRTCHLPVQHEQRHSFSLQDLFLKIFRP